MNLILSFDLNKNYFYLKSTYYYIIATNITIRSIYRSYHVSYVEIFVE